ncbi:MAG: hypothetical protein WB615_08220 [Candidatus Tumulicola sp.]
MQSSELLRREYLRLKIFGWIIVVFAITCSVLDLFEYRHAINASNPGFAPAQWERMTVARKRQLAPRYLEWEILIIAVSLGSWLLAVRRHRTRVRQLTGTP